MYESPINVIYGQMQTQMEGDIFRAVQSYAVDVDKEELLRALRYDRDQYEKGYADGKRDAMADLVRCKDCKYYDERDMRCDHPSQGCEYCSDCWLGMKPDDFCSYGERREGE